MLKFKKLMSLFLAVLMLCGALTGLSVITASATDGSTTDSNETVALEDMTEEEKIAYYHTAAYATPQEKLATMKKWSTNGNYTIYADEQSGEVAVEDMTTGQVLFSNPYDIGNYDKTRISDNIKSELMSQVIVHYTKIGDDQNDHFYSFTDAAVKDQIKIRNIKNGIRVEYTIGREEARRLVPRSIEKDRFESLIKGPMEEYYGITLEEANADTSNASGFYLRKQLSYFTFKSIATATSDALKQDLLDTYPVLEDMDIYVLDASISTNELEKIEQVIKTACPNYSYEEMDYDHQMTQYEGDEENPPLFKLALEYTLGEDGFDVRLPANGLRFNESMFSVNSVEILPYMGAGNVTYDGYVFLPDGSGTLISFEDVVANEPNGDTLGVKLYGEDYAYHSLEQKCEQVARYPVYGIVESVRYYDYYQYDEDLDVETKTTINGVVYDAIQAAVENGTIGSLSDEMKAFKTIMDNATRSEERVEKRGFSAVITEGDALSELKYTHHGTKSPYEYISLECTPRPHDEYNLADAISVGSNTTVPVTLDRKYVGSYRLHVTILSDETLAEEAVAAGKMGADDWYEASWLGMAMAYRDYLVDAGILTALEEDDVSEDIPLYIESFGAMETIEKILSIPVEVTRPLTSADNVYTMYQELSAQGVANINFKLTGYANGGMYSTMPYKLDWEKAVSEDLSMEDLFDLADIHGRSDEVTVAEYLSAADVSAEGFVGMTMEMFTEKYGKTEEQLSAMTLADYYEMCGISDGEFTIFPDFDFSYVTTTGMFDGFSMRKHAIRTIDDRYAYKREYMATQQRYAGYYQLAISPAYFDHFYTKLLDEYLAYDNVTGISVGSLGSSLNSDFDEDEPYNREDSKSFIASALDFISNPDNGLEVMVDGGNSYTWEYVDHMLNVSLDSSRYLLSSYSVPFIGVVLHGYVNFAGTPLNMDGDVNYAKLKAIENGASVYFTLSYQNTQNLKDDVYLSKYYSVRYDIWFDDVVEIYNELNTELSDVQTMPIIGHSFMSGVRVLDTDELDRDLEEEFQDTLNFQGAQQDRLEQALKNEVSDARQFISTLGETIQNKIKNSTGNYSGSTGEVGAASQYSSYLTALSNFRAAEAEYEEVKALYAEDPETYGKALTEALESFQKTERKLTRAIKDIAKNINKVYAAIAEIDELLATAETYRELILSTDCPANIKAEVEELCALAESYTQEDMGMDFVYTTANLQLETFLDVQYLIAVGSLEGEENFSDEQLAGLYEKQYETVIEKNFGLLKNSATYVLLRYLDANKDLTDAELDAKYSLKDGEDSLDGLVLYVKELLGDGVTFDPVLVASDKVDDGICDYIMNRYLVELYTTNVKNFANAAENADLLKTFTLKILNINPNQHGSVYQVNNIGIYAAIKAINKELDSLINKSSGSVLVGVTDGNYSLDDLVTEEQMNDYITAVENVLESMEYENVQASATPDGNYIEYLGDDASRREDIRNYIETIYYTRVIQMLQPSGDIVLPIQNAKSNSMDSLELLLAERVKTYGGDYSTWVEAYNADLPYVRTMLQVINDELAVYGDITADLEASYYALFVEYMGDKTMNPGQLSAADPAEPFPEGYKKGQNKSELNKAAEKLIEEKLVKNDEVLVKSFAEVEAVAAEIVALNMTYPLPEGYDATASGTAYVYYKYFSAAAKNLREGVDYRKFYYDEMLSAMDAYILGKISEREALITAKLTGDYTTAEYLDVAFDLLADPTLESTNDIIDIAADMVTYTLKSQKRTMNDDVTEHYLYSYLNSVQSAVVKPESYPLSLKDTSESTKTNAIKAMKTYLDGTTSILSDLINRANSAAEAGEIANYSLASFLTADELQEIIDEVHSNLLSLGYVFADGVSEEQQKAETLNLIKHFYYEQVMKKLSCDSQVDFNLHETYDGSLEASCESLKALVKYFTLSYNSNMDEAEFDTYFETDTDDKGDETDEEESRYISDDGRIVSVTYGQKNESGGYTPYKTFILNYNNFSVKVVYEGITYTIPAYGYVTVIEEIQ